MNALPIEMPVPQACHQCGNHYAGAICQICKAERPAFTALKNIAARESGAQPLRDPLPPCKYAPGALCDCEERGLCLEPA